LFEKWDSDNDGVLSASDCQAALNAGEDHPLLHEVLGVAECDIVVKAAKFLAIIRAHAAEVQQEDPDSTLKKQFEAIDQDNSGGIDAQELLILMRSLGHEHIDEDFCRDMIDACDDNGDGRLQYHEFQKLMQAK
jgi:Ca2+-binding EF-hand superfamily protein